MNSRLLKYLFLAAAIFYFILPYDLIPDFFGLAGRFDDVLVLAYVWYQYFKKEADEFKRRRADGFAGPGTDRQSSKASGSGGSAASQRVDPYKVLGISSGAPQEEITAAYRQEAAKYHPDKVNHLGEDLQKVAHEKMLEIQKAYDLLIE